MSTDRSPNYLRGFLIPLKDFSTSNTWPDESVITEGTKRAGTPTADNSGTSLLLTARGIQPAEIDIKTIRGGHVTDDAKLVWKESTESTYYGHDIPTMISDISVPLSNGGSVLESYTSRNSIRLSTGKIVHVYEATTPSGSFISSLVVSLDGSTTQTTIRLFETSSLSGQNLHPCLCLMPDDSILCAYWVHDPIGNVAQINISRSKDEGYAWELISSRAIPNDISTANTFGAGITGYDLDRLSMASNSYQVLLFAGLIAHDTSLTTANSIQQYASTSEATIFKLISTTPTNTTYYYPQIVQFQEAFIISWIRSQDSIGVTRINNAFENMVTKISISPIVTISAGFGVATSTLNRFTGANKSLWLDTDGRIYLAYVSVVTHRKIYGAYSDLQGVSFENYGQTWHGWGAAAGVAGNKKMIELDPSGSNGDGGIINISGVSGQGNQGLFVQYDPDGVNAYSDSIFLIQLGGWATLNYPALMQYPLDKNRAWTTYSYLPIDKPDQGTVWTQTITGVPTVTIGTALSLSCPAVGTIKYSRAITDKTTGIIVHLQTSNIIGSSTSAGNGFEIKIQEKSSTDTLYLGVVITSNAIHLYDLNNAGYASTIATVTGLTITKYDIIVQVDNKNNKVELHYAEAKQPRRYSKLSASLTTDPNTTQSITWGILRSLGTIRSADWHQFSYSEGSANGLGLNDTIFGKQYPAQGFYVPIIDGTEISTLDGPAREGDIYSIAPVADSPISRVIYTVDPSRDVPWRSDKIKTDPDTNNVPVQKIAWLIDHGLLGNQNSKPANNSIGIHLANINFKNMSVERYDSASTGWVNISNFTNSLNETSQTFIRTGRSIECNDANGSFLHFDECANWQILLDDGAGVQVVRKIKSNSEGVYAQSSSKRAILIIEDVKTSDPTSGSSYLIPDSCTILIHNVQNAAGYRLVIDAQRTNEGYFQIGTQVLGSLMIPANQYSRGRTITMEADIQEDIATNGILRTQKRGRGGRIARISWQEGVDISTLYEINADPDFWKASTIGNAIAAIGSAPTNMIGLIGYMQGSMEALVYLPTIDHQTGSKELINRYHDHMLCTMGKDAQIEHILGSESRPTGEGEVFRVGTIILRETR